MTWNNAGWRSDDGGWYKNSSAAGLALDGVANVKVAYSTRKLITAYPGPALRVQKVTGGATQDIGFVGGVLDTASLIAFCGASVGIVNIWYDQSGNANDAAPFSGQPSEAPVIYDGSAIKAINTKPAVFWNPSASPTNRLKTPVTANPVNTLYVNSVVNLVNTGSDNLISGTANFSSYVFNSRVNTGVPQLQVDKFGAGAVATSTNPIVYSQSAVYENEWTLSTGAFSFWIDGTFSNNGTNFQTFSAANLDLGEGGGGSSFTSGLQGEFIEIDQVGSFAGRSALQANQKAYWGTP